MYADLRHVGWDKADAFYAAFRHLYSNYPKREQMKVMTRLENDPSIKARIAGNEEKEITLEELAKETSKEKILSDLVKARRLMKEGTKEWIEITSKIADYTKIKQDEIKTDERRILYHLPARYPNRCEDCLIYQNGRQKKD